MKLLLPLVRYCHLRHQKQSCFHSMLQLQDLESQARQVELIDEDINNPDGAVFSDVIVDAFREQGSLAAVFAFDKSTHGGRPLSRKHDYISIGVFTQPHL